MIFTSGYFGTSLAEAAREENLPDAIDIEELYIIYRLGTLTGWTVEYIKNLGFLNAEAFLQIWDAEQALLKAKMGAK